jgi:hypothetical protein
MASAVVGLIADDQDCFTAEWWNGYATFTSDAGHRHYEVPSDGGGESAAAIYGLLGTAKLNGIDPESYLRNVLSRVADHPIKRIEELLPWNVAASLQLSAHQAA